MLLSLLLRTSLRRPLCAALAAALAAAPLPGLTAETAIATVPLASGSTAEIKPNILFNLDDSGSMDWLYMPNNVASFSGSRCYRNHAFNRIYYNPAVTYSSPPTGDGSTFLPNSVFTNAPNNGFDPGSSKTNLSTSATYKSYFRHNTTPTVGTCHPNSQYTEVIVSATSGPGSTDERTNYANWFSYYRSRMMTMKSAVGFAFDGSNLVDKYRVGFITINPNSPVSNAVFSGSVVTGGKFLKIKDYTAAHKQNFYEILYKQSTNGGTPLRVSLARAGRHFAGRADGINAGMGTNDGSGFLNAASDPVLYSCQQNFSILTTDGFWNDGTNPVRINGATPVGDQDFLLSVTPRPLFEKTTGTITQTTTTTTDTESYTEPGEEGCVPGMKKIAYVLTTVTRTIVASGGVATSDTTTTDTDDGFRNATSTSVCSPNPRALQTPNPKVTQTVAQTGGNGNTLADVAQYYYVTDLRDPGHQGGNILLEDGVTTYREDVGTKNDVPKIGDGVEDDKAAHQHMTTFTLGMGVPGTLVYKTDYKTSTTGDFAAVRQGTKDWPVPINTDAKKTDDLWHAAVNGRGQYFSASDPNAVSAGLTSALSGVSARVASAAAAATSNLEPVAGDNFAYVASYQTQSWNGDIQAREINLETGTVGQTSVWSARDKLQTKVAASSDTRTIYTFDASAVTKLKSFLHGDLSTAEKNMFTAASGDVDQLSQWGGTDELTATQKTNAQGANLVNFVRGQFQFERRDTNAAANQLYRKRDFALGDIVNAQPVYVRAPFFEFGDVGYKGAPNLFKETNANRDPMVFVASNDGMLHAFFAGTSTTDTNGGVERWAYIPSVALPSLYRLADFNYANDHQFLVDGTPTIGDACLGAPCATSPSTAGASDWKTMLVAGLNRGGKAYYALDITNPGSPKGLWEFKHSTTCFDPSDPATYFADCHLGYTYGNAIITKRTDGKWVVIVSSGYNNVNSPVKAGDGRGYLYVLEAATGKILDKISTGVGDATTPSGLGKINNWVEDGLIDATTLRVYGGDMLGNIWRFDINNMLLPSGKDAFKLAQLTDGTNPQPITTKPELSLIGTTPVVYAATGRYLGTPDLGTTQTQSVYGIKDTQIVSHCAPTPCTEPAGPATITGLRSGTLAKQTLTNTTDASGQLVRTVTCTSDCSAAGGWFVDLPDNKERVNVDMKLQLGTLVVASNIPGGTSCAIGGTSFINFFDYSTGSSVAGLSSNIAGKSLSSSLAVGLNVVRLPSGKTVVIATTSDNQQLTVEAPFAAPSLSGRRVSWREIFE